MGANRCSGLKPALLTAFFLCFSALLLLFPAGPACAYTTYEYDWDSMTPWRQPKSGIKGEISVAEKTSGGLIFVGIDSATNEVCEGDVADVDTLLGGSNTVTNWRGTGINVGPYGCCCVFRTGGQLWMTAGYAGSSTAPAWYRLYRSPGGNGGDWELHYEFYSELTVDDAPYAGNATAGMITVLDNGRWVLPGPKYEYDGYNYTVARPSIWTSDDQGGTWTHRLTCYHGPAHGAWYSSGFSKRVAASRSGCLYFAMGYDYGSTGSKIYRSNDNGATWSVYGYLGGMEKLSATLLEERDGGLLAFTSFYVGITNYPAYVYRIDDPDNSLASTLLKTTANVLPRHKNYVAVIDDRLIWTTGYSVCGFAAKLHFTGILAAPAVSRLDPATREASCEGEPIDTGTGAHVMERTLLTVNGARELPFKASYNSLLLNEGPLGKGWGHNFEARLAVLPNGDIDLHWTANRVNRFLYNGSETYSPLDLAVRYDTLVKNPDGSYTLTRKDKSIYEFNAAGRLVQVKNKYGQPIDLSYNIDGRLETIAEVISGRALTVTYNVYGLIDRVTDPLGRSVSFSYDGSYNLTRITDPEGHYINYTYNSNGQVERATDEEGIQIFYDTYDELGRVVTQDDGITTNHLNEFHYDETTQPGTVITTVYDRNGNTKVYTHDSSYNLLSVKDQLNRTYTNTYYEDGNIKTSTNPKGITTNYGYDPRGNLTSEVRELNGTVLGSTYMSYYADDNLESLTNAVSETVYYYYEDPTNPNCVTRKIDPLSKETKYEYYPGNGLLKKVITPLLNETTYTYVAGQVYEIVDAAGKITAYSYDAAGRLQAVSDGAGKTTTYQYDGADNLLSITDPLGHTTSYTYDGYHSKLTETDARDHTTYYQYDNNRNLGKVSTVVGGVYYETTYQYDGEDRLRYVTDANGYTTEYQYFDDGSLWKMIDPELHTTEFQYDELGRLTGKWDARGIKILTVTYDDLNKTQTITDALNRSTVRKYDALGRLEQTTDPLTRVTRYQYDALDRLVHVYSPVPGVESSQRFDDDGNLEAMVDPNNYETGFDYHPNGMLWHERYSYPGGTITYDYNSRNLVQQKTNARGQATSYQYYDDSRLASFTDPDGTVSYQYDPNGNVETVTEGVSTITREYDELNRVKKYTDSRGNVIRYEYDPVGNLTVLTYPGGKQVNYTYYKDNRLKTVTDWNDRITTYEYYPNGLLWKTARPNGTVQVVYYDDAGQLTQLKEIDGSGNLIIHYNYTYKDDGTVETEQSSLEEQPFAMPDTVMTYTYDNRLATFNGQPVEYDADGNMTYGPLNGSMAAYTFDSRNRLMSVDGTSYIYDAENNRIGVTEGVYRTEYVVNPHALLSQALVKTDAEGNQTFYIYGLGLIAQEENGIYRSYHYDLRGSTVALTDETGTVTDRFQYGPYGELVDHRGNTQTPFLYNGRDGVMTDADGLYYMRARYYNPELRRFINRDLVLGTISNPLALNTYSYCVNDTINHTDPAGLLPKDAYLGVKQNQETIKEMASKYSVDPYLIAAVIVNENIFRWGYHQLKDDVGEVKTWFLPSDVSIGLGQMTISTAFYLDCNPKPVTSGVEFDKNKFALLRATDKVLREDYVERLKDPKTNIEYIAKYFAYLQECGGFASSEMLLDAYNNNTWYDEPTSYGSKYRMIVKMLNLLGITFDQGRRC
ncbi:MAG: RHS repeat-associated core domain-containing protein [Bacillota bacterium]